MFFRPVTSSALAELKVDTTYNASVVLFAAALLKNEERFSEALSVIEKKLVLTENSSFNAWMLGRVALAAIHMNKQEVVDKTLPVLKNLLNVVPKDECYAWALGYLAAVNPAEYKANSGRMMKSVEALAKPGDVLWAHVMNLQAAAKASEVSDFNSIVEQMKLFTKKTTVAEALSQIPADDWRAWALGITIESATVIGKKDLYHELSKPLADATKEAVGANALLAQISATAAAARIQQSTSTFTP